MKFFKIIFLITSILFCVGCSTLRPGEARILENRVLGMDLSIPIVGASNQNIINIKFGWIETRFSHTYKTDFSTEANQDFSFYSGTGTVHRIFSVTNPSK